MLDCYGPRSSTVTGNCGSQHNRGCCSSVSTQQPIACNRATNRGQSGMDNYVGWAPPTGLPGTHPDLCESGDIDANVNYTITCADIDVSCPKHHVIDRSNTRTWLITIAAPIPQAAVDECCIFRIFILFAIWYTHYNILINKLGVAARKLAY